jgi:hypothetical protein
LNTSWSGDLAAGANIVAFDPLKTYLNLPVIFGKLQGFTYLRAGLRIEIRINGTRFHYGQLVAGFTPLDGTFQEYGTSQLSATSLTMFPSLVLDPGPSQVGVLEIPYVFPQHFMRLTGGTRSLGKLHLKVLVPLRVVAETETPTVTFTVYVSLVDPVLNLFTSAPTASPLRGELEEQSMDASHRVTPEANNMMATDITNVSANTGMRGNNTIENEEQYIGVSRADMQLATIYTKPNFVRTFSWTTTHTAGQTISSLPVSPAVRPASGHPHFLSNLSRLAQFWRGSLRYHVRVIASGFHSGRLLISWDHESNEPTDLNALSNRMSIVVDVQETTEVYFTIPHMARYPWMVVDPVTTSEERYNGTLYFSVLNPLAVPDNAVSTVDVLVWMYGSDDLEFALPTIGTNAYVTPLGGLEEQCAEAPLGDPKFGKLDGSFSIPGHMSMGERITSVKDFLAKKTLLIQLETSTVSMFAASVFQQTQALSGVNAILPYCHFRIIAEMYLLHRGTVDYAGFAYPGGLGMDPYEEYFLSCTPSIASMRYGAIQVRSATPNAMVSVPYYYPSLFHTTRPATLPFQRPGVVVATRTQPTGEQSRFSVWASAGHDYMLAYLIPPEFAS